MLEDVGKNGWTHNWSSHNLHSFSYIWYSQYLVCRKCDDKVSRSLLCSIAHVLSKPMIVKKYANLLFEQSQDARTFDEVTFVTHGILADSVVSRYFLSQADKNEKEHILFDVMNKYGISKVSSNFIKLVMRHKRIRELPKILEAYSRLRATASGERIAQVVSASAIGSDDSLALATLLESTFKAKIIVQHTVDPNIIGGIVVKCDGMFLDASIKGAIDRISTTQSSQRTKES